MWREFKAFLLKQNMLALAIAVVIGAATNKLVQAIVDDFIMPLINPVTGAAGADAWQKAVWALGPVSLKVGDFASVLLNFVIIGFVCWRITVALIKEPKSAPKPATKECPFCVQTIDARATRCPSCTSDLAAAPGGSLTTPAPAMR